MTYGEMLEKESKELAKDLVTGLVEDKIVNAYNKGYDITLIAGVLSITKEEVVDTLQKNNLI